MNEITDNNLYMDKSAVQEHCLIIAEKNIRAIKLALDEAQLSVNNETKSTAGDKHETSRAMAQLETEKLSNQYAEAIKLMEMLSQINVKNQSQQVVVGSLVFTNNGLFYLSVSLGKINVNGELVFAISPISPLGQLLLTKKEKDSFSLNGKLYVIEKIS